MATVDDLRAALSNQAVENTAAQTPENSYLALYNQLKAANQQVAQPQIQQQQPVATPQLNGWYQDNPEQAPTRQMNPLEQALTNISNFGEGLMNVTGWDPSKGFTPENIGRFIVGLPGQVVGAPLTGLPQGYEALTGQNIIDRPDEEGKAYDYELDSGQRLAQLGNFVVNDFGIGLGASARAIGTAGKVLGVGGKAAERMSSGMIKNAMKDAKTWEKNLFGIAGDVAEEAGEEFGQSYLDDTRWKTLDEGSFGRAVEGAKWGALGGGVMGGGARGVSYLYDKATNKAGNDASQNAAASTNPSLDSLTFEIDKEQNQGLGSGTNLTQSVLKDQADRMAANTDIPGSSSAVNMTADNRHDLNTMAASTTAIKGAFEGRSDGSQEAVAKAFGTDVETMRNIVSLPHAEMRNALQELLLAKPNKRVRVIIGRNPDTNPAGCAYIDIDDIYAGVGFKAARQVVSMFGADFDGDRTQIHFRDIPGVAHYVTRKLIQPGTGESNISIDYYQFVQQEKGKDKKTSAVIRQLSKLPNNKFWQAKPGQKYSVEKIIKEYEEGLKKPDANLSQLVAKAYDELYAFIVEHEGYDPAAPYSRADDIVAGLLNSLERKATAYVKNYASARAELNAVYNLTGSESSETDALADGLSGMFDRAGGLNNGWNTAKMAAFLGKVFESRSVSQNPFFRDVAASSMAAHMLPADKFTFAGINADTMQSLYTFAYAWSFRQSNVGREAESSAEQLFRIAVYDNFRLQFNASQINDGNIEEAMDAFTKVYNEQVDNINKAKTIQTQNGEVLPFFEIEKQPVSQGSDECFAAFANIFQDYMFDAVFSTGTSTVFNGVPIGLLLEDAAVRGHDYLFRLQASSPNVNRFFNKLVAVYNLKENRQAERLEQAVGGIVSAINNTDIAAVIASGEDISPYMPMLTHLVEAVQTLVGYDCAFNLGIGSVDDFVKASWGRSFLTKGLNPNDAMNAIVSALLSDTFRTAIALRNQGSITHEKLVEELYHLAATRKSMLLSVIAAAEEKAVDGGMGWVAFLTDLNTSYDIKKTWFDDHIGVRCGSEFFADVMKATSDGFALSAAGTRFKKANYFTKQMLDESLKAEKDAVRSLKTMFRTGKNQAVSEHSFRETITRYCRATSVTASSDILTSSILSRTMALKEDRDKGTTTKTADIVYQLVSQFKTGGPLDFGRLMTLNFGVDSIENFQVNRVQIAGIVSGDLESIMLNDGKGNRRLVTRQEFFERILNRPLELRNGDISDPDFFEVFESCPQLLSLLAPQRAYVSQSKEGATLKVGYDGPGLVSIITEDMKDNAVDPISVTFAQCKNQLVQSLYDSPEFYEKFCYWLPAEVFSPNISYERAARIINSEFDKFVNTIMFRLQDSNNPLLSLEEDAQFINSNVNAIKRIVDLDTMFSSGLNLDAKVAQDTAEQLLGVLFASSVPGSPVVATPSAVSDFSNLCTKSEDFAKALFSLMSVAVKTTSLNGNRHSSLPVSIRSMVDQKMAELEDLRKKAKEAAEKKQALPENERKLLRELAEFESNLKNNGVIGVIAQGLAKKVGNSLDVADFNGYYDTGISLDDFSSARGVGDLYAKFQELARDYDILKEDIGKMSVIDLANIAQKVWRGDLKEASRLVILVNSRIAEAQTKRIYQYLPTAQDLNADFLVKEYECKAWLDDFIGKCAMDYDWMRSPNAKMKQYIVDNKLPYSLDLQFSAKSAEQAFAATNAKINFSAARVATGIGMNGALLKTYSAIALLSPDFLASYGNRSQSDANPNASRLAALIDAFIDFVQEPMFLKLKRSMTGADKIASGLNVDDMNAQLSPIAYNGAKYAGIDPFTNVSNMLKRRRNDIGNAFYSTIKSEDPKSASGFKEDDTYLLSVLLTPYVQVNYTDKATGELRSMCINSSRFDQKDTTGMPPEMAAIFDGSTDIKSVLIVPVSFDEMAGKILNAISIEQQANPDQEFTMADYNRIADTAALDWEHLNTMSSNFVDKAIRGIRGRRRAAPSMATLDFNPSQEQRMLEAIGWTDLLSHAEKLKRERQGAGVAPGNSNIDAAISLSRQIMAVEEGLSGKPVKAVDEITQRPYGIVSVSVDKSSRAWGELNNTDAGRSVRSELDGFPSGGSGDTQTFVRDNETYQCANLYIGASVKAIRDAFEEAYVSGRVMLVDRETFLNKEVQLAMNGIPHSVITNAYQHVVKIGGVNFVVINPASAAGFGSFTPVGTLSQIRRYSDPDSIRLMLVDPYRVGDAAMYLDPDVDWGFQDITFDKLIPISNLISSVTPVEIVSKLSDIEAIQEDFKANKDTRSKSMIDISYWQSLKTMGDQTIFNSIEKYLNNVVNSNGDPAMVTNAQNGDCVGFIKTTINSNTVYVPILYTGNVPIVNADVSLSITEENEVDMRYKHYSKSLERDQFNKILEYVSKVQVGQFSYKVVPSSASDTTRAWPAIGAGAVATRFFGKAHAIIDGGAFSSRIVEKAFELFCRNAYAASRKMGGNLFFNFDENANEWVISDKLSDFAKQKLGDTAFLNRLLSGDKVAWTDLVSARENVFSEAKLDTTFKNISKQILARNGDPVLFFCPTMLQYDKSSTDVIKAKSLGLNGYDTEIMSFLQHWEYDVDSVMQVFNAINENVCAESREISLAALDSDDAPPWLLAHNGMVYSPNTDPTGKQKWFYAVIDRPNFFGENEMVGDISRNASFSYQRMLQTLLRSGCYSEKLADTIKYMQMNADAPVLQTRKTDEELIRDAEQRKEADHGNTPRAALARQIVNDNMLFSEYADYRRACDTELRQLLRRIEIKADDQTTKADEKALAHLQNVVSSWESAIGIKPGTFDINSIMPLVLLLRGSSYNDGSGDIVMTTTWFEAALKDSMNSFRSTGLIIPGGRIASSQSSIRVYQALLPQSFARAIWKAAEEAGNSPLITKNGNYNAWVTKMFEAQQNSLNDVVQIDNDGKRRALARLNDAVAMTWDGFSDDHEKSAPISGYIGQGVSISDLEHAIDVFGPKFLDSYMPGLTEVMQANREGAATYLNNIFSMSQGNNVDHVEPNRSGPKVFFRNSDKTVWDHILNTLVDLRRALGILNPVDMPLANIGERVLNQGVMSAALKVGQEYGIGIYAGTKGKSLIRNRADIKNAAKNPDLRRRYSAFRTAEMYGVQNELLSKLSRIGANQLDEAIDEFMEERGLTEKWTGALMNIMSGKDLFIDGQIENFIELFATHAADQAPYWGVQLEGRTMLERAMDNPGDWFTQIMVGRAGEVSPDFIFAMECMNVAKKGDMAQRNLVSAIFSELAKRSTMVNFLTTAFVTPYFNYTTNRMGKILQWVAPVSTIHKLLTDLAAGDNFIGNLQLLGTGKKLNELGLETVQVNMTLQEAIATDMMHLGPMMVAMLLIGSAGGIEPPEDEDKWGNFEEWTILGQRIDVAWWLEDLLGLALPVAILGKSAELGKPRIDLLINGMAHYLSNNPVTKVADACAVLFDPFEELYRDYDDTLDSFAKAWGGAPSMADMVNGKFTSWGLSFVSQFITPLALREIYNSSQEFEKSYKRIYQEGATGRPTSDALEEGQTQMATYQDAIIRKYTRNNPVMGFLADLVIHPNTGYMAHEMPRTVYYDPAQMNSLEIFSMYKDPYTKSEPLGDEEKEALAMSLLYTFQRYSVDELAQNGFVLDYETKDFFGGWLWDRIADLNEKWYQLDQDGQLDYHVIGWDNYNAMKKAHYDLIDNIKSLYYDKLWSDDLTVAKYNRRHTQYAQDANGEWYATGYYPNWFAPITFGPGETEGDYQYVMSRENDWATESIVTGYSTGERGLIPITDYRGNVPKIESYSSDGTNTGKTAKSNTGNGNKTPTTSGTTPTGTSTTPTSGTRSYGSRSGGGGGGSSPNIYYHPQSVQSPNATVGRRTTREKADLDYLRPNFETKGSREAYKRSDI